VVKATHYIENAQMADGSWYIFLLKCNYRSYELDTKIVDLCTCNAINRYGNWGICYTYAAYIVLVALAAVGKTHRNSEVVCKGCDFLLSKQLKSGGWGESYLSCRNSVNHFTLNE
jgi:beta-amyrin synthase